MMTIPTTPNTIDWDALRDQFPALDALEGCPQDPIFHAEGDVWTHTRMVVTALMDDPAWQQADARTQRILWWAALFHDIAKPMTTEISNGRVLSPRHAIKGAQLTQSLLYEEFSAASVPLPFAERQEVVALVRYHGLPLWFWDKADMLRAVISASLHVPCAAIATLARADVLGRICDDQADLLDRIALFREYCAENQCLDAPYPFASDHSRFRYFQNSDNHPSFHAYDESVCEVTMLSGLPASGKDTWIAAHTPDLPVISLDALRDAMGISPTDDQTPIIIQAKEQARDYLRAGQSFVWNATNLTRRLRTPLIDLFTNYKARVRLVYLEAAWDDILSRNAARERGVPVTVLQRMAHMLDVPSPTEADIVEWHIT